jgi:hypothetical protein
MDGLGISWHFHAAQKLAAAAENDGHHEVGYQQQFFECCSQQQLLGVEEGFRFAKNCLFKEFGISQNGRPHSLVPKFGVMNLPMMALFNSFYL